MDFAEIAALGAEPTPAHLEPFVIAYLEQHGPTRRGDLRRAIATEWLAVAGRPFASDVTAKLKKTLSHMEQRGAVMQSGVIGIWQLRNTDSVEDMPWTEEEPASVLTEPNHAVVDEGEGDLDVETDETVELGNGQQLVYCFYLPVYRQRAESVGETRWPIKIGRTTGPLETRLAALVTAMPERPVVAMKIWTHDADLLEKAIQNVLSFRGYWLSEAAGSEWYLTSPEEITRLYEFIRGEGES